MANRAFEAQIVNGYYIKYESGAKFIERERFTVLVSSDDPTVLEVLDSARSFLADRPLYGSYLNKFLYLCLDFDLNSTRLQEELKMSEIGAQSGCEFYVRSTMR